MTLLPLDDYLTLLDFEGDLFTTAIRAAEPSAPVPTCPGWTMRDLVLHQGEVHRWATTIVRHEVAKPSAVPADNVGEIPDDTSLATWFGAGLDALLTTLRTSEPSLRCFTFLADAPPPLLFWARRQAHETGMHRVDAESASGVISPFAPSSAADGIDELLTGFVPRKNSRLRSDRPLSLQIEAADTSDAWHLTITDEPPVTVRGRQPADCTVRGAAADLHPALWHRPAGDLEVQGDPTVFDLFRTHVTVTWS
jgi:uncharacterized protein (TIGR03083 family)